MNRFLPSRHRARMLAAGRLLTVAAAAVVGPVLAQDQVPTRPPVATRSQPGVTAPAPAPASTPKPEAAPEAVAKPAPKPAPPPAAQPEPAVQPKPAQPKPAEAKPAAEPEAKPAAAARQAAPQGAPKTETLVLVPPEGWNPAFQDQTKDGFVAPYLPKGQDLKNWRDMIQTQVFYGVKQLLPAAFLDRLIGEYRQNCRTVSIGPRNDLPSLTYDAATQVIACGESGTDNKGEVTMIKVIAGKDSLYAVHRAWRVEPFDAGKDMPVVRPVLAEWRGFFARVRLCDPDNPAAPCPAAPKG